MISWPEISNANDMDFDLYTLHFEIFDGDQTLAVNSSTAETYTTLYEYRFHASALDNNLTIQITINAVNRCKDIANRPLQVNCTLHKGLNASIMSCEYCKLKIA